MPRTLSHLGPVKRAKRRIDYVTAMNLLNTVALPFQFTCYVVNAITSSFIRKYTYEEWPSDE